MKITLGCDEAGFEMKQELLKFLHSQDKIQAQDAGCYDTVPVLYPDVAAKVARAVQNGESDRAILICGTGIGMAISANKLHGIRAAVCHDIFSTERSILSNDAQIMCLGARVIAPELALKLVQHWLGLEFPVDSPSAEKVKRIGEIEGGENEKSH